MTKSDQDGFYKRLGEQIRSRREKLGLTRLDFAKGLKMTPQQMSRVEDGSRRVDVWTLYRIADNLRMTIARLISVVKKDKQ